MTLDEVGLGKLVGLLRKWADVLDIPSGDFVNQDLLRAADALTSLIAERDGLEAWFDGLTPNEMDGVIVRLKDRALAAEAQLKAAREALGKAASLLEVVAEDAKDRGDTATWAMADTMASDLSALSPNKGEGV